MTGPVLGPLIAAGRTSDVYELGADAAVKVPRADVPGHWMRQEADLTAAVRRLGAAAPEVVELIEVDGRESIVFGRVDGPPLWDQLVDGDRTVDEVAGILADNQRSVWRLGLTAGIDGFVDRLIDKIESSAVLSEEERQVARRVADGLPWGAALLHGDLHPGNILMGPDGPVLIDWFDAGIGHPLADILRSSLLVRPLAAGRPHLRNATPGLLGRLHAAYLAAIAAGVSWPEGDVRDWEAVIAAGRLTEAAEFDDSPILELWRLRDEAERGSVAAALSAGEQ